MNSGQQAIVVSTRGVQESMNRQRLYLAAGAIVLAIAVIAGLGLTYIYVRGGSGEASAPISAPELAASTTQQKFRIDQNSSQVAFTLTEELMGKPKTVVGTTNQVAGDIVIDANQPANSKLGTIRIDARTLATDSSMRDRMIRSTILQSSEDAFEYITFTPTALTEMPDKVTAGQSYTFKVTGDLTVRDVTKPVTFDVTAKLATDGTTLDGTATTTVQRATFNLEIPNVPSVANVSEDVKLEIKFVAAAVSADSPATQSAVSDS
jgi:polyisoprenoid-binding protein YceI